MTLAWPLQARRRRLVFPPFTLRGRMRLVVITFAALGLGIPLAGGATPLRIPSGVHGVVMRGPTKPVCPEEQSCEEPAAVSSSASTE
jgi:hypothetical protein